MSLTARLVVQCLTLFVVLPLGAAHPIGRTLHSVCDLAFAAVSAIALTRRRLVRSALWAALALLLFGTSGVAASVDRHLGVAAAVQQQVIPMTAFVFNALVTALVAARVFGPGRVTAYRIQGAVLVYLNVAALFSIVYGVLEAHAPGAIVPTTGGALPTTPGLRPAVQSYFSLVTITTTGYGDLVPVHPLARSLANLEAVFGQLFPATVLARLVSLQLAHSARRRDRDDRE